MKTCLTCSNLTRCSQLVVNDRFDYKRLVTEDSNEECTRWAPIGVKEQVIRKALFEDYGLGALQAVHMLPTIVTSEANMEDVEIPDFREMLKKGVTHKEREQQLKYETDKNGNFVLDPKGEKIPRMSYGLRSYATSNAIGLDSRTIVFWSPPEIIKVVMDKEKELGLILTPSEKKKMAVNNEPSKEKTMPVSVPKRVMFRTPRAAQAPQDAPQEAPQEETPAPAKARGGAAKTTAGVQRAPATAKKAVPVVEESGGGGGGGGLTAEAIQSAVEKAVAKAMGGFKDEVLKAITEAAENTYKEVAFDLTIAHDLVRAEVDQSPDGCLIGNPNIPEDQQNLRYLVRPEEDGGNA